MRCRECKGQAGYIRKYDPETDMIEESFEYCERCKNSGQDPFFVDDETETDDIFDVNNQDEDDD